MKKETVIVVLLLAAILAADTVLVLMIKSAKDRKDHTERLEMHIATQCK